MNNSLRSVLRWVFGITHPVHRPLYFSILMRILSQTTNVLIFALASGGLVGLITGEVKLYRLLVGMLILAVIKAITAYLEQFSGHYVAFKSLELLRTNAFASLWPKAPHIINQTKSGDLLSILTKDIDRIEVLYAHTIAPIVAGVVVPISLSITAGIVFGWDFFAVLFLGVVLAIFVVPLLGFRYAFNASDEVLGKRKELTQYITDCVFGAEEVVGYGQELARFTQLDLLANGVYKKSMQATRLRALRRALNVILHLGTMCGVLFVGVHGGYSPVVVACVLGACITLFEAPRGIEDAAGAVDTSLAAARRLYAVCHAPQPVQDGTVEFAAHEPVTVHWQDVTYRYPTQNRGKVLDKVSFVAEAGKHLVISGHSGSGKSTAVKLLLRYDDPNAGVILLAGKPVQEYTLDSLRRAVAYVPQKSQLLNGTIAQNLRLGNIDASDEELWEVLETVCLAAEIRKMPQALATLTGVEGSGLSGGQVQRLCLARALLTRPKVLVLDEFTANLNVELEQKIHSNLQSYLQGITVIEITHRVDKENVNRDYIQFEQGKILAR